MSPMKQLQHLDTHDGMVSWMLETYLRTDEKSYLHQTNYKVARCQRKTYLLKWKIQ